METSNSNESDPVRANTTPESLKKIDTTIEEKVLYYSTQPKEVISERIAQLEREWDIERWLETNASSACPDGVDPGAHQVPELPAAQRNGVDFPADARGPGLVPAGAGVEKARNSDAVRDRSEKFALKVLRGDFQDVSRTPEAFKGHPATEVISAVKGN